MIIVFAGYILNYSGKSMVNQYVLAVIITCVVIGFTIVNITFIDSLSIQTNAESTDVYPKFKNCTVYVKWRL